MTIKELIEQLSMLPPDALVMLWDYEEGALTEDFDIEKHLGDDAPDGDFIVLMAIAAFHGLRLLEWDEESQVPR